MLMVRRIGWLAQLTTPTDKPAGTTPANYYADSEESSADED